MDPRDQDALRRSRIELSLLEARLANSQRIAAIGDWEYDFVNLRLLWSDEVYRILGLSRTDTPPNSENFYRQVHPDDLRFVRQEKEAVADGLRRVDFEHRIIRPDGAVRYIHQSAEMIHDNRGQPIRESGTIQDITERKRMEAQLLRAQRMQSIGTLAGGIAHDLNNVLAPIMMSIELLKQDLAGDPRRTKLLDSIYASSRRGADLVRQVLAFGRGMDGQRMAVRLGGLIEELRGIISETFPRNIQINVEVPPGLWPVEGDPGQLHQVFLNLLVNARDAMPDGGTLTIAALNTTLDAQYAGTSPEARPGTYVRLRVTDTGVGMTPEMRERIFEPFFTTKNPDKGTGIGLATVLSVVKGHGGFLSVTSAVGRGTTFDIHLPADPALRSPATVHPFQVEPPHGRGELVLVVDDERSICDITKQTLEAFGYRVLTARDGAEALAVYGRRAQEVALVIMDMMMPVLDGVATIEVLTRMNPCIRIIAASGLEFPENLAKASQAGAPDFLPKPYSAQTLLRLVRAVLDRPVPA